MAWTSATPRNSTSKVSASGVTSLALTVTSTTLGDLGVILCAINGPSQTPTPPAGWTDVGPSVTNGTLLLFGWYRPNMPSGTTTLTVTTLDNTSAIALLYGCWAGGSSGSTVDGFVGQANVSGASPMPSITSGAFAQATELVVGFADQPAKSATGSPTGAGTWTSVTTGATGGNNVGCRMASILGPAAGAMQTMSGITDTGSVTNEMIMGFSATALAAYFSGGGLGMTQAVRRAASR